MTLWKVKLRIKNIAQNSLLLLIGIIIAFATVEALLRIYNPFEFRVKGDKIILPVNKEYIFKNNEIEKLDKIIIHKKNSLGFRGEEPPKDFKDYLTIITIGGSTTECFYLSEGKTWTDILGEKLRKIFKNVWINNAGFDGQSTFGHIVLMEDYVIKLRPKVVLFLIGYNDVQGEEPNKYDRLILKEELNLNSLKSFFKSAANYSETLALMLNIYRYTKALKKGIMHKGINLKQVETMEITKEFKINDYTTETHLKAYEARVQRLVKISRQSGIEPILITQPALHGYGIDDLTGVDLGKIKVGGLSGSFAWKLLEAINDITRKVGQQEGVLVIDLARKMPKDSRYYYDLLHFTNEGAEKVAEIIYNDLYPYLIEEFGVALKRQRRKL
jgi:lysophospholipase L1-like esterase